MSVTLPEPIAAYLEAKKDYDTDALLTTLTDDAVITDEGVEYRGPEAIRAWNERASKAVQATYRVQDVAEKGDEIVVTVEVAGNFPTSPVTLHFHTTLRSDKIASMTMVA
jgi:ketosteroid isomerase-like protein